MVYLYGWEICLKAGSFQKLLRHREKGRLAVQFRWAAAVQQQGPYIAKSYHFSRTIGHPSVYPKYHKF